MHLWEESTLQAVGKQVGLIRDIDVDSGSLHVTVNGFNPLVFQMVVPFDTGDEVVVSLDYEKLAKYCTHCLRLTHDVNVCPELKRAAGRSYEDQTERRGVPRQHQVAKPAIQGQEGGWEKPRKTAKRALDFPSEEISGGFHYQMEAGDNSRQNSRRVEKNQVPMWGQKRGFPGTWADNNVGMGTGLPKERGVEPPHHSQGLIPLGKGVGPAWPKPLYQPKKKDSKVTQDLQVTSQSDEGTERDAGLSDLVMEDVPEMQDKALSAGLNFEESSDDLLEEGEYPDGEATENRATEDVAIVVEEKSIPMGENGIAKGDATKQKGAGTQAFKEKECTKAGVANRGSKKGTVALPKPPADT